MGKTVESYRLALESEINRWSGFARALRKEDREAFEELLDMVGVLRVQEATRLTR